MDDELEEELLAVAGRSLPDNRKRGRKATEHSDEEYGRPWVRRSITLVRRQTSKFQFGMLFHNQSQLVFVPRSAGKEETG